MNATGVDMELLGLLSHVLFGHREIAFADFNARTPPGVTKTKGYSPALEPVASGFWNLSNRSIFNSISKRRFCSPLSIWGNLILK